MAVAPALDLVELLFLPLLLTPGGEAVLRALERLRGSRLPLTLVERSLVAFYLAGVAFYGWAYLPGGPYTRPVVLVLLLLWGLVGWGLLVPRLVRAAARVDAASPKGPSTGLPWGKVFREPLFLLGLLTLFLLAYEVIVVGTEPFPNTFDGSIQSMYVTLLLLHGNAPLTLVPVANMGVAYPQGTAVWLSFGTVLFGWPAAEGPVLLPPLFMALSVPAAYAWGARLFGPDPARATRGALLFAAAAALLLTWPRWLVGGSYDFLFSVPLFLLLAAWLSGRRASDLLPWETAVLLGLGLGIVASLSPVSTDFFVVLLLATELSLPGRSWRARITGGLQTGLVALLASLFELPSFVALGEWWNYPGHVLTPVGGTLLPTAASSPVLARLLGLTDPFLFRPQDVWLSPFPVLKVELAVLLAGGLLLAGMKLVGQPGSWFRWVPKRAARHLLLGVLVGLLLLSVLVGLNPYVAAVHAAGGLVNVAEVSILLFVFYGALALVPLVVAAEELLLRMGVLASVGPSAAPSLRGEKARGSRRAESAPRPPRPSRPPRSPLGLPPLTVPALLAVAVIAVPLGSGVGVSLLQAPSYLQGGILGPLANVSEDDAEMLAWMASHLPACSGVLVAPGSAAEFLPTYDPEMRVLFPMEPTPHNLSYQRSVLMLQEGNYTPVVRSDLLALGVTAVAVTGESNVLWAPFQVSAFVGSSDFELLYPTGTSPAGGDAYLFEFVPGAAALHCTG